MLLFRSGCLKVQNEHQQSISMNFLLDITTGTQKGLKTIVKVVIGPVKSPKVSFFMCWLWKFGPAMVQKIDN